MSIFKLSLNQLRDFCSKKFIPMIKKSLAFVLLIFTICFCSQKEPIEQIKYSTSSDSTLYYYHLGWQQIMDFGDYSEAENSYRKALRFDSNFLVGQSVLARLTTDLNERLALYKNLEDKKGNISGDERLILDVYIALTKYTNLRDQKSTETKNSLQDAFELCKQNFGIIVRKYPNEIYMKSEYIEVIHSLYGAKATLDTINIIVSEKQKDNPFILGYTASLNAEIGNYESALIYANELKSIFITKNVAKPDAILADIYFKMNQIEKAKIHVDRANKIDPNNLDASRLKAKIDLLLE